MVQVVVYLGCLHIFRYSMSWPVSSSSTVKSMASVPVVCDLVWLEMAGSGVCGSGGGVGRMVREHMRWATGWSGVDWLHMAILGGMAGGNASVSTLGGRAGVCTGD